MKGNVLKTEASLWFAIAAVAGALWAGAAQAGPTPEKKCEAGKNDSAGKYAQCLAKAEKSLLTNQDSGKYAEALNKCQDKLVTKWGKLEEAAVKAETQCPSTGDQSSIQDFLDACQQSVAEALAGGALAPDPVTCASDLGTCTTDLSAAYGGLLTCAIDLSGANAALGACNGDLSACNGSLATCAAGTAVAGDVLAGRTFSSSAGVGVTGTMPDNGAVTLTPGTSAQAIAAGYHNGSGSVAGDSDLVAANVASGVNIFGVTGTAVPAQPLKTGQTQCDQGAGTLGSCPGSPAGQDAALSKGAGFAYTDNGDGTITDTKTGLVWEKLDDNNVNGIHDYHGGFTWYNAFSKIQVLNGDATGCLAANNPDSCCTGAGTGSCSAFAGKTDWRLPNVRELQTLPDFGRGNPPIDPAFNTACAAGCTVASCSCTRALGYWSSTTVQNNPILAWFVRFDDATTGYSGKVNGAPVRAVRGGS